MKGVWIGFPRGADFRRAQRGLVGKGLETMHGYEEKHKSGEEHLEILIHTIYVFSSNNATILLGNWITFTKTIG